ncbi:MAG: glycosyltransferase [Thalassobaculales bacterium]
MIWVQHLLGSGHLRRAAAIARAAAARGDQVLLASGGMPLPALDAGDARFLQLPALRARDSRFSGLVDAAGADATPALLAERARLLAAAFDAFAPDLLLVEHFPYGRRALAGEVMPLAERARRAVVSVRDVLVPPEKPGKRDWILATLQSFDAILVHGDPSLLAFTLDGGRPVHHTGYIVERMPPAAVARGPEILVSAGGGAVGARLMAVAAAAAAADSRPWRLIAGDAAVPAAANLAVDRFREDFPALLAAAAASVSQAGYNTVVQGLAAGVPMVLVPFAEGAESEQTARAEALAARGLAELLPEAGLTPSALLAALARAQAPRHAVDLGGLPRTLALLRELA